MHELSVSIDPRPYLDLLRGSPLHVLARDYPETLTVFRAHRLSLVELGGHSLDEIEGASTVLTDLQSCTGWRPEPTPR